MPRFTLEEDDDDNNNDNEREHSLLIIKEKHNNNYNNKNKNINSNTINPANSLNFSSSSTISATTTWLGQTRYCLDEDDEDNDDEGNDQDYDRGQNHIHHHPSEILQYHHHNQHSEAVETLRRDKHTTTTTTTTSIISSSSTIQTETTLLSTHINTQIVPMKTLIRYAHQDAKIVARQQKKESFSHQQQQQHDDDDSWTAAMADLSLCIQQQQRSSSSSLLTNNDTSDDENHFPRLVIAPLPEEYVKCAESERKIAMDNSNNNNNNNNDPINQQSSSLTSATTSSSSSSSSSGVRQYFAQKQEARRRDIRLLLQQKQEEQEQLQKQMEEEEERRRRIEEEEERQQQEKWRIAKEEAAKAKRERELQQEQQKQQQDQQKQQEQEQQKKETEDEITNEGLTPAQEVVEETVVVLPEEVESKSQSSSTSPNYVARAEKMVAQLKQVQASVEPFEKSKVMAKRRLGMKKIVNGKVNTLAEDVDKIRSVAADVSAAIQQAKDDDAQIEQLIQNGNTEYTRDMTKGKRYFVDLLCSKVIVRVQAEGFNGPRGDGFPLAHMLSIVAQQHVDLVPILAAHVYTVCPTAIPRWPDIPSNATEDDVRERLGMLKINKPGQQEQEQQYETFERFLGRTEGLISIVANIMSSQPSDHSLFSGHAGAVKWLSRFLSGLPNSSPLPLITAPVLDAFLTGAGHMLALAYPDEFQKYLKKVEEEVMPNLDESAVGKPSATRLAKTLKHGFQGFKDKLPNRAIGELYHGSTASGFQRELSSAPKNSANYQPPKEKKKGNSQQQQNSSSSVPFGTTVNQGQSPFGQNQGAAPPSTQSLFGQQNQADGKSPFGQSAGNSLFGQQNSQNNPSPFGEQPQKSSMSDEPTSGMDFGNNSNSKTPPGKSESMMSDDMNNGNGTFGASSMTTTTTNNQSTFGGNTSTPLNGFATPFVSNMSPAPTNPSPFGAHGTPAPNPSPFGAPASGGFGGAPPTPSPFGNTNNAMFSSNINSQPTPSAFGGGGGFGNFNSSNAPPFTAAPNASPFGAPNASPFGGGGGAFPNNNNNMSNSPFGGGSSNGYQPSPFGNAGFGATGGGFGTPAAPGGGGMGFQPQQQPQYQQQQQQQIGGGGDQRPICKFFAQGRCRNGPSCRFRHETPAPTSHSFQDPFGGGPRR